MRDGPLHYSLRTISDITHRRENRREELVLRFQSDHFRPPYSHNARSDGESQHERLIGQFGIAGPRHERDRRTRVFGKTDRTPVPPGVRIPALETRPVVRVLRETRDLLERQFIAPFVSGDISERNTQLNRKLRRTIASDCKAAILAAVAELHADRRIELIRHRKNFQYIGNHVVSP